MNPKYLLALALPIVLSACAGTPSTSAADQQLEEPSYLTGSRLPTPKSSKMNQKPAEQAKSEAAKPDTQVK